MHRVDSTSASTVHRCTPDAVAAPVFQRGSTVPASKQRLRGRPNNGHTLSPRAWGSRGPPYSGACSARASISSRHESSRGTAPRRTSAQCSFRSGLTRHAREHRLGWSSAESRATLDGVAMQHRRGAFRMSSQRAGEPTLASSSSGEPPSLSIEEWAAMPEDEPGELVSGWLVEEEVADYEHETVLSFINAALRAWSAPRGGFVAGSEAKFAVGENQGRKPDLGGQRHAPRLPRARARSRRALGRD